MSEALKLNEASMKKWREQQLRLASERLGGSGVIAVHPDCPPLWIKRDGTVEELPPSPAPVSDEYVPGEITPLPYDPYNHRQVHANLEALRPFAELVANAADDSILEWAEREAVRDDYVIAELPVTLGMVRQARKALGGERS